jgi:hypothetical protein
MEATLSIMLSRPSSPKSWCSFLPRSSPQVRKILTISAASFRERLSISKSRSACPKRKDGLTSKLLFDLTPTIDRVDRLEPTLATMAAGQSQAQESIMGLESMSRPLFGIIWDSGLSIWLTGDMSSKPMCRLVRGHCIAVHKSSSRAVDHDWQNVSGAREAGSRGTHRILTNQRVLGPLGQNGKHRIG